MIAPAMMPTQRIYTPRQIVAEKEERQQARRSFLKYCQYVDPKFETPAHVRLVAAHLQEVCRYLETGGKEGIGRLMILMPPRHGKTEPASKKFPSFVLGRMPDARIILTSYGADLATRNSRDVRETVISQRYQAIFGERSSLNEPVILSSDSRSSSSWDLAQPHRGGVTAAGVGGGITGLGANLLVIDDPFKNREEAESEGRRELVDDWYKSSAHTRLESTAAIIVFHTRWHPDDLAGQLIKRMVEDPRADQWKIIFLPALALGDYPASEEAQREKMREGIYIPLVDPLGRRPGEALWIERYDTAWLEEKKSNIGIYDFEALYQQMPYLREGGFFKREWFTIVDEGPGAKVTARVRYWDKAATQGGGARTSGVRMSKGKDNFYYVEHVANAQFSSFQREEMMARIGMQDYEEYGPFEIWHPQDPGSAGLDSARATNVKMAEAGLRSRFEPVTGDKETRAGPVSSAAEGGKIRLVRSAWNEAFLDELISFPKGRFKDQVDAFASAFSKVADKRLRESRIL
uniref:Putative terminase n=1 Tax=viral metagenome TaxID=1070528 RepID=A0A6H1ZER7_9ZZZZ